MPHTDEDNRSAAKFLMENVALLPRGRVLDLAMGTGRNALYLAKIGFSVHGVDISPETVKGVLKSATATGLTLEAEIADLDGDYRIKENAWDVIICFYYLQRSLMARIKDGLRKGGILVYETFTVNQVQFGRPTNPNYLLRPNELRDTFRDFRCLRYREGIVAGRKAVASLVAEKT